MKHLDFFKRCGSTRLWCLLALVALTANIAKAELIFSESFNYTTGNLYSSTSTNGWWQNTGTETEPIQVISGSLTYAGYESTAVGQSIKLKDTQSAQKVYKKFNDDKMVASGSIYYAALINIESAADVTDENTGYFLAMCAQTYAGLKDKGSGTDVMRLSAYAASKGKYKLAISRANTTLASTTAEYDFGTTYLVVVKYTIVEGMTNDVVSLYVNPTASEPANADAVYNGTSGSDVSTTNGGFAALVVRQGATATKKAPILTLDAIKVATAWDDLFESGSTPEPSTTPTIKSSTAELEFGNLYVDGPQTLKFTVTGTDLTGDITLVSNNTEVVLDKATITQAEAKGGVEVTATLTAATAGAQTATITLSSEGATDVTIAVSWTAIAVTQVATIAALKAAVAADGENYSSFQCTGEAVVTYTEAAGSDQTKYYVEDATGAVRIDDWSAMVLLKVGDKIKDFIAFLGDKADSSGQPLSFGNIPTVVSSDNEWTPQVVTLKQLRDNAADYLLELVKVENVTLDRTEPNYKAGNTAISQNSTDAAFSLTSDNTLVGTAKPATADIVGISYFTSGYNIRVRTATDIVAKTTPTGLCRPAEAGQPLCYAADGLLHIEGAAGEVAIYNLTGLCVVKTTVAEQATIALPQGVYAVKVAGNTHKIVVR